MSISPQLIEKIDLCLRNLAEESPHIELLDSYENKKNEWRLSVNVKSYIKENKKLIIHTKFTFTLCQKYEKQPPIIKITPPPFHPNFKITKSLLNKQEGVWAGEKNLYINELIKLIIQSLKYHHDVIQTEDEYIGNREALDWYLKQYHENPKIFPFTSNQINIEKNPNTKFQIENKNNGIQKISKKTFTIEDTTPAHTPTKQEIPKLVTSEEAICDNNSNFALYIKYKAKKVLTEHIGWNRRYTDYNINEQGGLLLGNIYFDDKKMITYGIVEITLPGNNATGTSVYLDMNHETWKRMIDLADKIIDKNPERKLQIIGWYHTHPNNLDVYMSDTDMNTQSRFFTQDWHFAVVLNPQKAIWKVFHGKESKECMGAFLKKENIAIFKDIEDIEDIEDTKDKKKTKLLVIALTVLLIAMAPFIFYLLLPTNRHKSSNKIVRANTTFTLTPSNNPYKSNSLTRVCLNLNKQEYIFTATSKIKLYDINQSQSEGISYIQNNDTFMTGKDTKGQILGIEIRGDNKWFYISYKNKRYWAKLDDILNYSLCNKE